MVFSLRGAHNSLENFHPDTPFYVADRWNIISDLNINALTFRGGGYGNVFNIHINDDAEWAFNLDNLLDEVSSHGVQTSFIQMGTRYRTLLGIRYEDTTITEAKAMIDKLAGANNIGRNFITDSRVWCWIVHDEPNLEDIPRRNWIIAVSDYIRLLGGKTGVAHPRLGSKGWFEGTRSKWTEPILRGHVDYLIYHIYRTADFMRNPTYDAFYAYQKALVDDYVSGRGSYNIDQIIINAYGIWMGSGSGQGFTGSIPDDLREIYYRATLAAINDGLVEKSSFYFLFQDKSGGGYGIVLREGTKTAPYEVIKSHYVTGSPPPPPPTCPDGFHWNYDLEKCVPDYIEGGMCLLSFFLDVNGVKFRVTADPPIKITFTEEPS